MTEETERPDITIDPKHIRHAEFISCNAGKAEYLIMYGLAAFSGFFFGLLAGWLAWG